MDDLLRAGLWYLRGRDRDLLVDTGNGVGALAPVSGAPRARRAPARDRLPVHARAHRPHRRLPRVRAAAAAPGRAGPRRRGCATARRWRRRCGREPCSPSSPRAGSCRRRCWSTPCPYRGLRPVRVPARARRPDPPRAGRRRDRPRRPPAHHRRPAGAHAGQHRAHRPRGARPHLRRRRLRRRPHRHAAGVGRASVPADDGACSAGSTSTSCTRGTAGRSTARGCARSPRRTCASAAADGATRQPAALEAPVARLPDREQRDRHAGARHADVLQPRQPLVQQQVAEQDRHRAALGDDHRRHRERADGDGRGEAR